MSRRPRLDDCGVLLDSPVGEGDEATAKEAEWVGPSVPLDDANLHDGPALKYESVKLGDDVITLGDYVYLTPEAAHEPCEIGRVVRMYEKDNGEKMVWVQWYWRPEHVVMPPGLQRPGKREVFRSQTFDENPMEAVERKCSVVQLRRDEKPSAALKAAAHHFYFFKEYEPKSQTFAIAKGSEPLDEADGARDDKKRKQGGGGGERPAKAARLPKQAEETLEAHGKTLDEALERIRALEAKVESLQSEVSTLQGR